ncbi:MAG: 50S ribosomal protein L10 [Bacteroidales bacterium]|nr:50S ribosomal protein L10 [Bacteroidales bacterium]
MKKELKDQVIESISTLLSEYPNFYITDIAGLNAEQTTKLRRLCFEQNVKLTVVKNTLFSIALKRLGNEEINQLLPTLEGNTAIMYTETPNAPAKLIKKLMKEGFEKPVIKGAYVQECAFVGTDKLDELAAIKSKEELIGDIIAMLQSPAQRVLSALENASEGLAEDEPVIKGAVKPEAEEAPAAEDAPAAEEAPAAE